MKRRITDSGMIRALSDQAHMAALTFEEASVFISQFADALHDSLQRSVVEAAKPLAVSGFVIRGSAASDPFPGDGLTEDHLVIAKAFVGDRWLYGFGADAIKATEALVWQIARPA